MRKKVVNHPPQVSDKASGNIMPELVANLMRNLPGMAYRCKNDEDWTMIFLSEGCFSVTGYLASEILHNRSMSFNDLIIPDDRDYVRQSVEEAITNRTQFQMEYRIIDKVGETRWVWEQGNAIYSADDSVMFLDGYISDITSRKNIEDQIKQVAKTLVELNSTKDKFFSLIAHDLQNPVYAIISLSEFLAANLHNLNKDDLGSFVAQIQVSAKGIFTLLENLLDWTKSQTGKIKVQREYLSLPKLISFVVDQLKSAASEKGIVLEFVNDMDLVVESDSHLLATIIRNLVSNAIKYSHPNTKVNIVLSKQDSNIVLEVIDSGIGISRRNVAKIFSIENEIHLPGTRKEAGSGLGLVLAKDFADNLGIRLSVISKLGKGSTFKLEIPEKSN